MSVNIGIFKDALFTDQYSVDRVPYQADYDPIFGGIVFNATDGDARNVVVYLREIHPTNNYHYSDVQASPVELAPFQRDPDQDGINEWRVFIARPVETAVTGAAIGTGNGTNRDFTLPRRWVRPGSETVRLGATVQLRNIDYWINYARGVIRFAIAPGNGITVSADYTHGDNGTGAVNVPTNSVIEANGDWVWTPVWPIPHGHDTLRGTGNEVDGVPIIVRGRVDPGTTDPQGNAITLFQQQIRVKGWEHNARL